MASLQIFFRTSSCSSPQRRPTNRRLVVLALAAVAMGASSTARADDNDGVAFFEAKVRPLLIRRCLECHGEKKASGGLRLDSRGGWQRGGDSGPAALAGKVDASRLIQAVRYADASLEMPPDGKLPAAEIAVLEEWVRRGAPDPRTDAAMKSNGAKPKVVSLEEGRNHWAFRPVVASAVPTVRNNDWPRRDIDRFLLDRLEKVGITPSPDADRHTWLRRVTFDLTGLPPAPDEIAAFLADDRPGAEERVVDRLLASHAFGERWARHWLDLVGYADQIGTANDVFAEHAWRYRDYVIGAFNADTPFDRFVREQIAGDLLPARPDETPEEKAVRIVATGFLVLGNVDIVESDKDKLRVDVVDQQIEKVGKALLGQSLHCARCHDHKFDPIRQIDYYALAGIFGSTESVYVTGQGIWSSVKWTEIPETPQQTAERERLSQEHAARVSAMKTEHAAQTAKRDDATKRLAALPTDADKPTRDAIEKEKADAEAALRGLDGRIQHAEFFPPKPARTYAVNDAKQPGDARITIRGDAHALGDSVPRGFVAVLSTGEPPAFPSDQSGRVQLADWLVSPRNPLTARVAVNRFWQKLYGEGLVRGVDYFGLRGETPSHPELLDHLATRFMADGWSVKRLLRTLVLTRAYRMSSEANERAEAFDPDNRLLGRMNRQRLDAEQLRDAALTLGNDLLRTSGGTALPLEYVENTGNLSPKSVNPASFSLRTFRPEQRRLRTIYLPVVRSTAQKGPSDALNFFDFAQPAQFVGQRPTTSVPTQSLFLLNGPLFKEQARRIAEVVLAEPVVPAPAGTERSDDDVARLATVWLRVLNRPMTAEESTEALEQLTSTTAAGADRLAAWASLCHALMMSNEFLFRL